MPLLDELNANITASEHRFNIETDLVTNLQKLARACGAYSRWALTRTARRILENFGVTTTHQPTETHPHAACKTIDCYLRTQAIPRLLNAPFTAYWTKPEHAHDMSERTRQPMTLSNACVVGKDYARYGVDDTAVAPCQTGLAWIHDAAHYLTPADIVALFTSSKTLHTVYATIVLPAELLDGEPPLLPDVYTFQTVGHNDFLFYPDGHAAGAYHHTRDQLWWLRCNQIVDPAVTLTLTKLDGIGAHHLFQITSKTALAPKYNVFDFPGRVYVPYPAATPPIRGKLSIDRAIFEKTFAHSGSVAKATYAQIRARARAAATGLDYQTPSSDQYVAAQFAATLHAEHMEIMPEVLQITHWSHWLTRRGPIGWVRRLLNAPANAAWEEFVQSTDLQPYTALTRLRAVHTGELLGSSDHFPTAPHDESFLYAWARRLLLSYCLSVALQHAFSFCGLPSWITKWLSRGLFAAIACHRSRRPGPQVPPPSVDPLRLCRLRVVPTVPADPDVRTIPAGYTPPLEPTEEFAELMAVCPVLCSHPAISPPDCLTLTGLGLRTTCPGCLTIPDLAPPALPARSICLFTAVAKTLNVETEVVWAAYATGNARGEALAAQPAAADERDVRFLAARLHLRIIVRRTDGVSGGTYGNPEHPSITIQYRPGHYSAMQKPRRPVCTSLPTQDWQEYTADPKRAKNLLDNIDSSHYGKLLTGASKSHRRRQLASVCKTTVDRTAKIHVVLGAPGAGKSTDVITWCRRAVATQPNSFKFVTPTDELRAATKTRLNLPPRNGHIVKTPEFPLDNHVSSLMILDEAGRLPPGYLDLLLLSAPTVTHIYITADPAQAYFHCPKEGSSFPPTSPLEPYLHLANRYIAHTHRLPPIVADCLGITTTRRDGPGTLLADVLPDQANPLVSPSTKTANTAGAGNRDSQTYAGSQGLTYPGDYELVLSSDSAHFHDRLFYTALTRGRRNVRLLFQRGLQPDGTANLPPHASPIARALISGDLPALRLACQRHVQNSLPEHLRAALGSSDVDLILAAAPEFAAFVTDVAPEIAPEADEVEEEKVTAEPSNFSFGTAWTRETPLSEDSLTEFASTHLPPTRLAEYREAIIDGMVTQQVNDCTQQRALFLRHQATDEATAKWTLQGRYVHAARERDTHNSVTLGLHLFDAFCNGFKPKFTPATEEEWLEAQYEDQARFLAKGRKAICNIVARTDADWDLHFAEMFTKAQSITKPGTEDRDAKMGQLVISFNTEANFHFGPLAKLMSRKFREAMPDTFYCLDGHTDADTSAFVRTHWDFSRVSSEDDYTAFDQSQGMEFLQFDNYLMQACGIPKATRDDYLSFMTHLRTWLGPMGVMMPSGCKFTLLFNTTRSAAYQQLKYTIPHGTPMCATGDDVALNAVCPTSAAWDALADGFRLVSKRQTARFPTFCGWVFHPVCCYKRPELLLHRTVYQADRGLLGQCALNYLADITPLHLNLEAIHCDLTEEQLEQHFETVALLTSELHRQRLALNGTFTEKSGLTRHYCL